MSSHHFVKEGQEPALFILEAFSFDLVAPLLEWAPLVVVADSVVETVLIWGIKIDVVLQALYSVEVLERILVNQNPIQILPGDSGNAISQGLQFLIQSENSAVNIITTPATQSLKEVEKFTPQLQIAIYNDYQKWSRISSGKFEKWKEIGSKLIVWQDPVSPLQTQGLVEHDKALEVIQTGMVTVESKSRLWIGEDI